MSDFLTTIMDMSALPVLAFCFVLAIMPVAIAYAQYVNFTDKPGGRKKHDSAVALVGGLVLFPVFAFFNLFAGFDIGAFWPLYAGMAILLAVGAYDDRKVLEPRIKFTAQWIVAIIIVTFGEAHVDGLGYVFGDEVLWLGPFAWIFSVVAAVLLINAINLMDGLDGLSGGVGVIVFTALLIGSFLNGHSDMITSLLILIAALCGFLWFNMRLWRRARAEVFIGDAGSLTLGLLIAWFAMHLGDHNGGSVAPMTVAWILALPIYDTCAQFARRMREGRHPFSPDAHHFHHHFIHAGLSPKLSTLCVLGIMGLLAALGITAEYFGFNGLWMTCLWIGLLLTHILVSLKPARYENFIRRIYMNLSTQ